VKESAAARSGHAPHIRVLQGSEPPDFCAMWGDALEIHAAGRSDGLPDPAWGQAPHLFQIKGHRDFPGSTRACEVHALASSLFSGDVYVLVTEEPPRVFCWEGRGSSAEERAVGAAFAARMLSAVRSNHERVELVSEGGESDTFWLSLGGKADYAREAPGEGPAAPAAFAVSREPRLYAVSDASGAVKVEEVHCFAQGDLDEDAVFILDARSAVFLWEGKRASKGEHAALATLADEFVASAVAAGRLAAGVPVVYVKSGFEPPGFTAMFAGWDHSLVKPFVDPETGETLAK
jgi:hypothetical protein